MASSPAHSSSPDVGFHPTALIAAIALPGLGHIVRKEITRGIAAGVAILTMFFGGLFIGGIDVVDSKEDRIWYFGQILVGPIAFAADSIHQSRFKVIDPSSGQLRSARPGEMRDPNTGRVALNASPSNTRPVVKSIGRANELGTLICTLAGMLNLIVILDAGFPSIRPGKPSRTAGGAA